MATTLTRIKPTGVDPVAQFTFDSIATSTVVVGNVAISDSGNGNIQVATVAANGEIGTPAAIGSGGATVYNSIGELPLTSVDAGAMALVLGSPARMYVRTSTGWFNIALINTNPEITSGPDASYTFTTNGTPVVLTLVANDPEGLPIAWSSQVTTGTLGNTAVITQSNNVFTITPSTVEDDGGSFSVTFTASDGVNLATATSSFTLSFGPNWSITTQQAKIQSTDIAAADDFGWSVGIETDTAVVGATGEGGQGAAYIFTRSGTTWSQQAKLVSSDIQASDIFGQAVSISGNTVIISAYLEDPSSVSNAGAAYIFTRSGTTWSQQAKLTASDKAASDFFGQAVSISGNTAVVGAHFGDPFGTSDAGSVYVFTRSGNTWSQQSILTLLGADRVASDQFGSSTSIDGDTVIVGVPFKDANDAGAAYIFTRSGTTWSQQAKLVAGDVVSSARFGQAVSISGNTAVVGAPFETANSISQRGAAYIFTRSGTTWTQQAKLVASDAQTNQLFGYAVAISDKTVVITARGFPGATGNSISAAYIFTRSGTTWTQRSKIVSSDLEVNDQFGESVSINGDTVIVGANFEDTGGTNAGAAYIFIAQSAA